MGKMHMKENGKINGERSASAAASFNSAPPIHSTGSELEYGGGGGMVIRSNRLAFLTPPIPPPLCLPHSLLALTSEVGVSLCRKLWREIHGNHGGHSRKQRWNHLRAFINLFLRGVGGGFRKSWEISIKTRFDHVIEAQHQIKKKKIKFGTCSEKWPFQLGCRERTLKSSISKTFLIFIAALDTVLRNITWSPHFLESGEPEPHRHS